MVFTSYEFIYLFLPITLVVYFGLSYGKSVRVQHGFLVLSSLFFYGYFNPAYLGIIITSIVVNYGLAKGMESKETKTAKKSLLFLGILFNVGLLVYFKYYDFFAANMNQMFSSNLTIKNILLPLGISFFTFQQFSFLLAVYRGTDKVESFTDYCLFVSFFPQLVAGPIVLYKEMMPQFKDVTNRWFDWDRFALGVYIFCIGLFKKIVIADTVALFVNNGYAASSLGFSAAWAVSLSYTLQIYFDFSGYSDMAIGIGRMFNIRLPQNFNSPYRSKSITEFWQRWHMTLGRALSNYVYIPLGGNRKGLKRTCLNLLLTFLVSGLWHGAAWTFVLWGFLHGVAIVFERITLIRLKIIPGLVRRIGTFMIVNFLWVLFRAEGFSKAVMVYKGMFGLTAGGVNQVASLCLDGIVALPGKLAIVYVLGLILLGLLIVFLGKNTLEKAEEFHYSVGDLLFISVLFVTSTIHLSRLSTFIYFNF